MSRIINFDNISDLSTLDEDFILSQITELEIFKKYESSLDIGKVIKSPLRKDNTPSFGLYRGLNGGIRYKDFSTGEIGNCFTFVKQLFNCNFNKALQIISNDFKLNNINTSYKRRNIVTEELLEQFEKKIIPVKRSFNSTDYNYFNQFFVPLDYLVADNSYACKYIYLKNRPNNMILWGQEAWNNPIYCYEINNRHKIYRPLNSNKYGKWLGTTNSNDIFGLNKISKGELLIITSSMKDRWVLKRLGYTAIAPCSEAIILPNDIMQSIFSSYQKVLLFYDSDNAGKEFTNKMIKLYPQLKGIFIPDEYNEKDISDFTKVYKLDEARGLMKKLI